MNEKSKRILKKSIINYILISLFLVLFQCKKKGQSCSQSSDCESGFICKNSICEREEPRKCQTKDDCGDLECIQGLCLDIKDTSTPKISEDKVIVRENPPGKKDTVFGKKGAALENAWILVEGINKEKNREKIGYAKTKDDGSFPEISIGDNKYHTLFIYSITKGGTTSSPITKTNDIFPPQISFTEKPDEITYKRKAKFSITCNKCFLDGCPECEFLCKIDEGEEKKCREYEVEVSKGEHKIKVSAKDKAGNIGETTYIWKVIDFSSISAGYFQSSAIGEDKSLWIWGMDFQISPKPIDKNFIYTSSGKYTCGIREDGALICFEGGKKNEYGGNYEKISVGDIVCGITKEKNLICQDKGIIKISDSYFSRVSVREKIYAISTDGNLFCFLCGELKKNIGSFEKVSTGGNHICALKNESLWCWGDNTFGQIGNFPKDKSVDSPTKIMDDVLDFSLGENHTCAIKKDNSLWCWGDNSMGQLGTGSFENSSNPQNIPGEWKSISAGKFHTCAIKKDNSLWCWGDNSTGQLGTGDTSTYPLPQPIK